MLLYHVYVCVCMYVCVCVCVCVKHDFQDSRNANRYVAELHSYQALIHYGYFMATIHRDMSLVD